ncbi:MAG: hypothetical protein Q9159_003134 [Coniocarpon cinnabarinum]
MVRNLVIFGGSSHPALTETICNTLGIPPGEITLSKFSVGETRVEIRESVRGKDVYIIQSAGTGSLSSNSPNNTVNDHLVELLITISACKTASAKKVTAVLPLFPYSRQSDIPYNKAGAPLSKGPSAPASANISNGNHSFDSGPHQDSHFSSAAQAPTSRFHAHHTPPRPLVNGANGANSSSAGYANTTSVAPISTPTNETFSPQRGYKQWVAQAGTLVADLLTAAGADHIITMDLHDPQYQGFFDIPVDNLYGRHLLRRYIERSIPNYQDDAVIVSPDAGGAKRATSIADSLGMSFALIHKERPRERTPPPVNGVAVDVKTEERTSASMILVGNVAGKTAILIDDLADTSNTITRAAKLLQRKGAQHIIALVTHGVLSGDAIERIGASALDKVVVTNSVNQEEHQARCKKLEVLEVGGVFAEAIRRVHHGESISVLFQHD